MQNSTEFANEARQLNHSKISPINNDMSIMSSTNEIFNQDKNRVSPSMSFAKSANNCSFNVGDFNEHSAQHKPTLVEINLRAKRSVSKGKRNEAHDVSVGSIGVLGSNTQTVEDNFRNQLLMTSLNDDIIE